MIEEIKKQLHLILSFIIIIFISVISFKDYCFFFWGAPEPTYIVPYEDKDAESSDAAFNYNYIEREDFVSTICFCGLGNHVVISFENTLDEPICLSLYDYNDFSNPDQIISLEEVAPGETFSYVNEKKGQGYMISLYGDANFEDLKVEASNTSYMRLYKKNVYIALMSIVFVFLVQFSISISTKDRYSKIISNFDYSVSLILSFISIILLTFDIDNQYSYLVRILAITFAIYGFAHSIIVKKRLKQISSRSSIIFSSIFAASITLFFASRIMNATPDNPLIALSWYNANNLISYALCLLIFVSITLITYYLLRTKRLSNHFPSFEIKHNNFWAIPCIIIAFTNTFALGRFSGNRILGIVAYIIVLIFVLYMLYRKSNKATKINLIITKTVYAIVLIGISIQYTLINVWGKGFSDTYHSYYYFGQLYNIANNQPFSGGNIDKYGHFGLFYKIPMLIFGNTSLVVGICFAIVAFITYGLFLKTIHSIVDSNFIRIIAALCIYVGACSGRIYPMTLNGRLLVVACSLYFVVFMAKKELGFKQLAKAFLLSVFMCLWSTDAGIICSLSLCIYISVRKIGEIGTIRKADVGKILRIVIKQLLLTILAFVVSYLIIKLWNAITSQNFSRFLNYANEYDFGAEEGGETRKFIFGNSQWIYIISIFGFIFIKGLYGVIKSRSVRAISELTAGVICLGVFSFYVVRPEDFYCCEALFVICISYVIGMRKSSNTYGWEQLFRKALVVLSILSCTEILIGMPDAIENQCNYIAKYDMLNWGSIKQDFENFDERIPDNTYISSMDIGASLVYMNINKVGVQLDNAEYIISYDKPLEDIKCELVDCLTVSRTNYYLYKIVN